MIGRFDKFEPINSKQDVGAFVQSETRFITDSKGETTDEVKKFLEEIVKDIADGLAATKGHTATELATLYIISKTTPQQLENLQKAIGSVSALDTKRLPTIASINWTSVIKHAVHREREKRRAEYIKTGERVGRSPELQAALDKREKENQT